MTLVKKKWEFLDMDDKMHYKNKITNLQDKSSKLSKKVRQIKVNLGNEIDQLLLFQQTVNDFMTFPKKSPRMT